MPSLGSNDDDDSEEKPEELVKRPLSHIKSEMRS
jgi:hypothetical protein